MSMAKERKPAQVKTSKNNQHRSDRHRETVQANSHIERWNGFPCSSLRRFRMKNAATWSRAWLLEEVSLQGEEGAFFLSRMHASIRERMLSFFLVVARAAWRFLRDDGIFERMHPISFLSIFPIRKTKADPHAAFLRGVVSIPGTCRSSFRTPFLRTFRTDDAVDGTYRNSCSQTIHTSESSFCLG